MIVPGLVPLAALVLAAPDFQGFAGTLDVSNKTEIRARATQGAPPPNPSLDVADGPVARLRLTDRRWDFTLGYSALALLPDLEIGVSPQLLQSGDARVAWHDRHVSIRLSELATYGDLNSSYLLGGGPAPPVPPTITTVTPAGNGVQALPAPTTIQYGSSRTALASDLVMSRRWGASLTVDYVVQGGVDQASRAVLPLLREPRGQASIDYSLTRTDRLGTRAAVLRADSLAAPCSPSIVGAPADGVCEPTVEEAQLEEAWKHGFTRTLDGSLAAGAGLLQMRLQPQQPFVRSILPVARATLTHSEGVAEDARRVAFEALLAPVLDLTTGMLDERVQGTASATIPIRRVKLEGSLALARSVESRFIQPGTYFRVSVDVEYRVSRTFGVGVGAYYAWQAQEGIGTFSGEIVSAHATARIPTLRF